MSNDIIRKNFINCFIVLLFVFSSFHLFSMFVGNATPKAFLVPVTGTSATNSVNSSDSINDLVIKGATYFLKGKSDVDLLSSKLEISELEGISYHESYIILNSALENMKIANSYYNELRILAEETPYNNDVINQLRNFDYNSFKVENNLNGDIFNIVTDYLKPGDVRGAYEQFLIYTDEIVFMLEDLKFYIFFSIFPDKKKIWNINQQCIQMHLFGQYLAQVFYCL